MMSHEITLTVLTHPLQVLLIGMILARFARDGFVMVARARRLPTDPDGSAVQVAGPSDLQAA